jgi:hypothetical protein
VRIVPVIRTALIKLFMGDCFHPAGKKLCQLRVCGMKKPLSERRGYLTAVNTHMRKKSVYQWRAIIIWTFGTYRARPRSNCCRGRSRTSTGQLAVVQCLVVNPGRLYCGPVFTEQQYQSALCYVYPVIPTPETRGHVCQKFHHPTVYKN